MPKTRDETGNYPKRKSVIVENLRAYTRTSDRNGLDPNDRQLPHRTKARMAKQLRRWRHEELEDAMT